MSNICLPPQLASAHADFIERVLRYLDRDLSETELARLNEELTGDPVKRQIFITICRDSQLIHESQIHTGDEKISKIRFNAKADDLAGLGRRRARVWTAPVVSVALAASVVLAAALWVILLGGFQRTEPVQMVTVAKPAVATLVETLDVEWHDKQPMLHKGAQLTAGVLRLEKGLIRLETTRGVSITLEGPAEFEIEPSTWTRLHQGKLTAKVSKEGRGFVVQTKAITLADLGTSFGVDVMGGVTDVAVFDGEVEVDKPSPTGATSARRILKRGTAVTSKTDLPTIDAIKFSLTASKFQRPWEMNSHVISLKGDILSQAPGLPSNPYRYGELNNIMVFAEQEAVELADALLVGLSAPGRYEHFTDLQTSEIPVGQTVDSYLIQFYRSPVAGIKESQRRGSIHFAKEVAGVIVNSKELRQTDALFGMEIAAEEAGLSEQRGLEDTDVVELSSDRRTLTITLRAGNDRDQLRVLVKR